MRKITVKHFLNTNLKPYIINGDKYYSIYLMVIAHRQNTKVKSYAFDEYYSENDFSEITCAGDDSILLENEIQAVTSLVTMQMKVLDAFDTSLFAAIYNYFPSIFVFELDLDTSPTIEIDGIKHKSNLYDKNKNKLNIAIDEFFISDFSLKENNKKGMSIYTYFSAVGQTELKSFINSNTSSSNVDKVISLLNDLVYHKALEKLSWILRGSNKFEKLLDKYNNLFTLTDELYCDPIYREIAIPIQIDEYTDPDTGEVYTIEKG